MVEHELVAIGVGEEGHPAHDGVEDGTGELNAVRLKRGPRGGDVAGPLLVGGVRVRAKPQDGVAPARS